TFWKILYLVGVCVNPIGMVESCTALVEHRDGRFEILKWAELSAIMDSDPMQAVNSLQKGGSLQKLLRIVALA
ncbi:MAG: hypothetical protein WCF85_08040, partial [Rhodospirillaceae bacterium]